MDVKQRAKRCIIVASSLALFCLPNTQAAITLGEFYGFPESAQSSYAALLLAADGNYYGTTKYGGDAGYGTVFRLTPAGKLTVLKSLGGTALAGYNSYTPLIQSPDGSLYGTAKSSAYSFEYGGAFFRITTNADVTLFDGTSGANPFGALMIGNDGAFYGTTYAGGTASDGTVFKLSTNGTYAKLWDFTGSPDGINPRGTLVEDAFGNFYGTTESGGTSGNGTVFKLAAGGQLVTLLSFTGSSGTAVGHAPQSGVLLAGIYLYGTTDTGGTNNNGAVYRTDIFGSSITNLVSFTGASGAKVGANPDASLLPDGNGFLYGTTAAGGSNTTYGTVYKVSTNGAFTSLFSFRNTNGAAPECSLIFTTDGRLAGTTSAGGAYSLGTAFAITTNGILTNFFHFGERPPSQASELMTASDGNYYGTAPTGGQTTNGMLYRLTPSGLFTSLASFNVTNGAAPNCGLVQDANGFFYGTTYIGGANNYGVLYKCSPDGDLTALFSFDAFTYGSHPQSKLVFGSDGYLYGTTYDGTPTSGGTVFRATTNGAVTNLVVFSGANGYNPYADLIPGPDGNLYGSTEAGGTSGKGTLFKILLPSGTFVQLASFDGTNGEKPEARLAFGPDGKLYGVTRNGGAGGTNGMVFRATTNGVITPLVSLDNTNNGSQPYAGLLLASDGNFYGSTSTGGTNGSGTLFRLTTNGAFATLFSLTNNGTFTRTALRYPKAGLIQAADGTLLGVATDGGSTGRSGFSGRGAVFRLSLGISVSPSQPASPKFVSYGFNGSRQFVLNLSSATSSNYNVSVLRSTNLVNWDLVATNVPASNGIYQVIDAQATNAPYRFYRATSP